MIDERACGEGLFEAATYTCNHCEAVVVLNPERKRARVYCTQCDHYICDACGAIRAATLSCRPMTQVVDELFEHSVKG